MSNPLFEANVDQMQLTTRQVGNTVESMLNHAKELQAAVEFVNRWQGDAANAFRATMGINTTALNNLVQALQRLADNLGTTTQGVVAHEADSATQINATQDAGALTGAPLNRAV